MSVKSSNLNWSHLDISERELLGTNLLQGIAPELESENGQEIVYNMGAETGPQVFEILTDDQQLSNHMDFFTTPFSLTYDLGVITEINRIHLCSFYYHNNDFSMNNFELYGSDSREDLYNPQNLIAKYHRPERQNSAPNDWVYETEGSLRYFGFKGLGGCNSDELLRLGRIALFNHENSAIAKTIDNNAEVNTLAGLIPEIEGKYEGSPENIAKTTAYLGETLTAKTDITLTYKSDTGIDAEKIKFLGENVQILDVFADGDSVEFKITDENAFKGASIYTANLNVRNAKELKLTLKAGSILDLAFSDTTFRRGSLDFADIVCPDFIGSAANLIPTFFSPMGLEAGANEVLWELEKHHYQKSKPHCVRLWFQIDWITDNEQDYYARKYTFDSPDMISVKKTLEVCRDNGVEVLFNFGWKHAENIQDWFTMGGIKDVYPRGGNQAAPRDLRQFGIALTDTLEHLILDCGFDNIKYVTFYNEPRFATNDIKGDFAAWGDIAAYWAAMLRYAHYFVNNSKVKGMVDFWGAEQTTARCDEWMDSLNVLAPDCFTAHSVHRYQATHYQLTHWYNDVLLPHSDGKPIFLTECGNSHREWISWHKNHINTITAGADLGVAGAFIWILGGAPLPDPLNWMHSGRTRDSLSRSYSFWDYFPISESYDCTGESFYEFCLFSHYVPNHAQSVKKTHTFDYGDFRLSGFKSGSDLTICVENKGERKQTEIEVKLNLDANKKFYKYVYRRHKGFGEANLIVPDCEAEIFVGDTLCDTLGEGYEFAVYSTIPPIRQVIMSECDVRVKAGATVELSAEVLGCDMTPSWSISKSLMEGATLEGTTVKVPATAKAGEMLAVKAELPTGEFGIAIVQVV